VDGTYLQQCQLHVGLQSLPDLLVPCIQKGPERHALVRLQHMPSHELHDRSAREAHVRGWRVEGPRHARTEPVAHDGLSDGAACTRRERITHAGERHTVGRACEYVEVGEEGAQEVEHDVRRDAAPKAIELENVVGPASLEQFRLARLHDRLYFRGRVVPLLDLVGGAHVHVVLQQRSQAIEQRTRAHDLECLAHILAKTQLHVAVERRLHRAQQTAVALEHLAHGIRRVLRHQDGFVREPPQKVQRRRPRFDVRLQLGRQLQQLVRLLRR
jgi:hypothetical protein